MTLQETHAFFDRYRLAFDSLDGDVVADLWCAASGIADSGGPAGAARLTWWPAEEPMRANHRALCAVYRGNGFSRAEFSIQQHVAMGVNHAFSNLQWRLLRADGSLLQQFHTGYQLMRTASGPRVLLAVAHQENLSEMKPHAVE